MFKLLLCSVFIAPCVILPITSQDTAPSQIEKIGFEEAYVTPELDKIKACGTAKLDVFFHDAYITMHSAEYLAEAINLSDSCASADFTIVPIRSDETTEDEHERLKAQTAELAAILEGHNVTAKISAPIVQEKTDSLTMNGRSALLRIDLKSGENA